MSRLKRWWKSGLGNEVFGYWGPSSSIRVWMLVHPTDRRLCSESVCIPHPYMHLAKCLHAVSWGRRRWAVLSGCLPWQSLHGTKVAQSSPSPLVPLAQPPLCLGRGEWALMAGSTVMPRAEEPGQGALMLQLMSSHLAVPLAVSMGTGSPGCFSPWGCSPAGYAHSLTFTLPLLCLSPAPPCPTAISSPPFKPGQQLSLSPICECIQAVPCCLLPIPSLSFHPSLSRVRYTGRPGWHRAVLAGGGDRWDWRQSLLCSMAQFAATFDSLSGREAGKVTFALLGT